MKKLILSILFITFVFASIGQNLKGYYVEAFAKLEAKRAFVIDLDTFYATTQLSGIDTILATKEYVKSVDSEKVTGPASSTDNAIARYDGTTGKIIQNSGGSIDDNSNLSVGGIVRSVSASSSTRFGDFAGNNNTYFSNNLSYDGANWNLDNTAQQGFLMSAGPSNFFQIRYASPGTNPRTLTEVLALTNAGALTTPSTIQATTAKLTNLTDTYFPIHQSDAAGLINSNVYQSSNILTYATAPTFSSDRQIVDKAYVDAIASGNMPKLPVDVATIANITLLGTQTIDGYAVSVGQRVLVKNQSTTSQNGVYTVASGTWSRSTDLDTWTELYKAYVAVLNGTQSGSSFVCNIVSTGTLETDPITWVLYNAPTNITVSAPLTKSGNNVSLTYDSNTLDVVSNALKVKDNVFQAQLSGTGFVKASGTTISYDNTNYTSKDATFLGSIGNVGADINTNTPAEWAALPVGYSRLFNASVGIAGGAPVNAFGYFTKIANRDAQGGWSGLWQNMSTDTLYVGRAFTGSTFATWKKIWTSNNSNLSTVDWATKNLTTNGVITLTQSTTYPIPTLGTSSGGFRLLGNTGLYGLYSGVSGAGQVWMQAMRQDTATAYSLALNPSGGNILIGTSTDNTIDKLQVNGSILGTTAKLTNLTDGYLPLHQSDAAGLVNSNIFQTSNVLRYNTTPTFSNGNDIVNKTYVDAIAAGNMPKLPVDAATTTNITLSGTQTIDGYSAVVGSRILVWKQTTTSQNGVYIVDSGAWTRATDLDTWAELYKAYVTVLNGGQSGSSFVCTVASTGTLGTDPVTWILYNAPTNITVSSPLAKSGNNISLGYDTNTLDVASNNLKVKDNVFQPLSSILTATTAPYTDADSIKLAGIETGAEVNVNADWDAVSGDAQILNKPTLLSQFINDLGNYGGFLTAETDPIFASDSSKILHWSDTLNLTKGIASQYDLTTGLATKQNTLTTGNLTENITGLQFDNTRQVIGGSAQLSLTSGYSIPTTANQTNWTAGYNDKINSLAFSGTTTKTLTLTQQDGGTVSNTFTDLDIQTLTADSTSTTIGITASGSNSRIHFNVDKSATNELQNLSLGTVTTTTQPLNISNGSGVTLPAATTSTAGLLTSADKTKLDGIATGANNYTLPLAANGTRGGIQIGYTATGANLPLQLSSEKGYVSLTNSAIVSGLGFTPYNATNPNGYTSNTGTVTSVAPGLGLTGGTITTSGTLSVDTASSVILSRQRAANTYQIKGNYLTTEVDGSVTNEIQSAISMGGMRVDGSNNFGLWAGNTSALTPTTSYYIFGSSGLGSTDAGTFTVQQLINTIPNATTTVKGLASFNSSNFTVSSGAVSITNSGHTHNAATAPGTYTALVSNGGLGSSGSSLYLSNTNATGTAPLLTDYMWASPSASTTVKAFTLQTLKDLLGSSQWTNDTYGITYSNNVGIGGSSSSTYKLSVTGNTYVSGTLKTSVDVQTNELTLPERSSGYASSSGYGGIYYKTNTGVYFKDENSSEYDLTNVVEPLRTISSTGTTQLSATDKIILVTGAGATITYPTVTRGKVYTIRNTTGTPTNVPTYTTLAPSTSTTVGNYQCITVVYDGSAWYQLD